ncbi:hypothetical protein ACFPER_00995 [Agromyces aurantiacus]|uniref:DUF4190 domain-containing protein n=1 Tax=Agromyces aurantiacus TaxID=165814 RepID=A0ABV9R0G7_9MICO|nr:hypothetical protein [Agromyces aurantiacus]MBM7505661.1 hypothetical protein [Agromyces aurantiacus]
MTDERIPPERTVAPAAAPPHAVPTHTAPTPVGPHTAIEPHPAAPAQGEPERPSAGAPREFDRPFDTGELHALPTGQLLAVRRPEPEVPEYEVEEEERRRVYSYVAAALGVIGAAASLFVGWMLPVSVAAIVFGVLGVRREEHGRIPAFVGIGAGIAGLVFSCVWIGYYAIVFGALPR